MKQIARLITAYLVLILLVQIQTLHAQQSTNSPPASQFYADCDCPKQKANPAFAIMVIVVGVLALFGLYKCAKKAIKDPPPPPPTPPTRPPPAPCLPPCGCTNPVPGHIYDWPWTNCTKTRIPGQKLVLDYTNAQTGQLVSFDYGDGWNSFKGLVNSTTNAFLSYGPWDNASVRDREGNLYNGWFDGTLPVESSDDLVAWQRTMTVTGWTSDYAVLTVFYDSGVPLATNYTILAPDTSSTNVYDWNTNVEAVVINPQSMGLSRRFYRMVPR
jgi:hypothetical protein